VTARPELEITPDPTAEERAAIEAAMAKLLYGDQKDAAPGAWWQAGILEATDEPDDASW
jgi:hypothetical protein